MLRGLVVAALVAAAAAFLAASWGPLRNLFSDYHDSPAIVYVASGGLLIAIAVGLLRLAVIVYRGERRPQRRR